MNENEKIALNIIQNINYTKLSNDELKSLMFTIKGLYSKLSVYASKRVFGNAKYFVIRRFLTGAETCTEWEKIGTFDSEQEAKDFCPKDYSLNGNDQYCVESEEKWNKYHS